LWHAVPGDYAGRFQATLSIRKLEKRRVLSANFTFADHALTLSEFLEDANQTLTISEIEGSEADASYVFELSEGVWQGSELDGISGNGSSHLTVHKALLESPAAQIRVLDNAPTPIDVDVQLQTVDFSRLGGQLLLDGVGELNQVATATIPELLLQDAFTVDLSLGTSGRVQWVNQNDVTLGRISAAQLTVASTSGAIRDLGDVRIEVSGQAEFNAATNITLADQSADQFAIGGGATFISRGGSIDVGVVPASDPASAVRGEDSGARVELGRLRFASSGSGSGALGHVTLGGDGGVELFGENQGQSLVLTSGGAITDQAGTSLLVGGAPGTLSGPGFALLRSRSAGDRAITLGDNGADVLQVSGPATLLALGGGSIDVGVVPASDPASAVRGEDSGATIHFGSVGLWAQHATIREDSRTHLDGLQAQSLHITTTDLVTQSGIDRGANSNFVKVTNGMTIVLAEGEGSVLLARTTGDPALTTSWDRGLLADNAVNGSIYVDWTVDKISGDLRWRNVAPDAQLPNLATGFGNLELWHTNQTIDLPAQPMAVAGDLTVIAGVDVAADVKETDSDIRATNPLDADLIAVVRNQAATITDAHGVRLQVAGSAQFVAAGKVLLADFPNDTLAVSRTTSFASREGQTIQVGVRPTNDPNSELRAADSGARVHMGQVRFESAGRVVGDVSINEDDGTELVWGSRARSLFLVSAQDITDADIVGGVGTATKVDAFAILRAAGDVVLGDRQAELRVAHELHNPETFLSLRATNASLRFVAPRDSDVAPLNLRDDRNLADAEAGQAGLSRVVHVDGVLFVQNGGDIVQVGSVPQELGLIQAERAAFRADGGGVILTQASFRQFAAQATGSLDMSQEALNAVRPDLLPLPPGADEDSRHQDLIPSEIKVSGEGGRLGPVDIDRHYAVVLGALVFPDNQADLAGHEQLVITSVADDAGNGTVVPGIQAEDGNVFVQTQIYGQPGRELPKSQLGNLVFDAGTSTDPRVVLVQSSTRDEHQHLFTAVAANKLLIRTATATRLTSELIDDSGDVVRQGVVTDVGPFATYDDRVARTVTKVGPRLSLTQPSIAIDAATTRVVYPPENIQRVELEIGRDSERNFVLQIDWADVAEVLSVETARKQRYEHQFDVDFSSTSPYLATNIALRNDPLINLFEFGAVVEGPPGRDVPVSLNEVNLPLGGTAGGRTSLPGTFVEALGRADQFVSLEPPRPEPPGALSNPAVALRPAVENDFVPQTLFQDDRPFTISEIVDVEYGQVANGVWSDTSLWPREWQPGVEIGYIQKIVNAVLADPTALPGRYEIRARYADGQESVTPFVKGEPAADSAEQPAILLEAEPADAPTAGDAQERKEPATDGTAPQEPPSESGNDPAERARGDARAPSEPPVGSGGEQGPPPSSSPEDRDPEMEPASRADARRSPGPDATHAEIACQPRERAQDPARPAESFAPEQQIASRAFLAGVGSILVMAHVGDPPAGDPIPDNCRQAVFGSGLDFRHRLRRGRRLLRCFGSG
jgi:hypothetical protein